MREKESLEYETMHISPLNTLATNGSLCTCDHPPLATIGTFSCNDVNKICDVCHALNCDLTLVPSTFTNLMS